MQQADQDYLPPDSDNESVSSYGDDDDVADYLEDLEASGLEDGEVDSPPSRPAAPRPVVNNSASRGQPVNTTAGGRPIAGRRDPILHRLQRPAVVEMSCQSLYDQIHRREIDLNPSYQRDIVWPAKQQSKLIDSILRGYNVPPVIFSNQDLGLKEVKNCVDGKQRLTSIYEFMSNKIPYLFDDTKYYWSAPPKKGKNIKLMPDSWKDTFARHSFITTSTYSHLSAAQEREMFQRVQLGMVLKAPEKWQALEGPWPEFARELRSAFFNRNQTTANILANIGWDTKREKDFEDLVRMIFTVKAIIVDKETPKTTPEKLQLALSDPVGPTDQFQLFLTAILQKLQDLTTQYMHAPAFEGKLAPVELVMTTVLIGQALRGVSDRDLLAGIQGMRELIRKETPKGEVKWKSTIINLARNYIDNWVTNRPVSGYAAFAGGMKSKPSGTSRDDQKKRKASHQETESGPSTSTETRNVRARVTPPLGNNTTTYTEGSRNRQSAAWSGLARPAANPAAFRPQLVPLPPLVSGETFRNQGSGRPSIAHGQPFSPVSSSTATSQINGTNPNNSLRTPVSQPAASTTFANSLDQVRANHAQRVALLRNDPLEGMMPDEQNAYVARELRRLQTLVRQGRTELVPELRRFETLQSRLAVGTLMRRTTLNGH